MLILCQFSFQSNAVRPLRICNNFSPQFWTMLKKSCKIRFPNQVTSTSTSTSTPCYHQHLFSGGIVNKDSCQVIFLIRYRDRRDRKDHKENSYKRDISIYKIMIYDLFWLAFPFLASSLDFDVPPSSPLYVDYKKKHEVQYFYNTGRQRRTFDSWGGGQARPCRSDQLWRWMWTGNSLQSPLKKPNCIVSRSFSTIFFY